MQTILVIYKKILSIFKRIQNFYTFILSGTQKRPWKAFERYSLVKIKIHTHTHSTYFFIQPPAVFVLIFDVYFHLFVFIPPTGHKVREEKSIKREAPFLLCRIVNALRCGGFLPPLYYNANLRVSPNANTFGGMTDSKCAFVSDLF